MQSLQTEGSMTTEETLQEVLAELRRPRPVIPVAVDIWDVATIAAYMKTSYRNVREKIIKQPSFPKQVNLLEEGRSHPRFLAREVIAWAEKR